MQFPRSYHEVIMFKRQLDLELHWKVKKGCVKINIKLGRNSDVKKIHVKLQHGTYNFWGVIAFTRSFDLGLDWKFKKVAQRSTSNLAEILIRRTSLPVKLQHDAGKFWGIIIFTRSCNILPFDNDLVQNVKKVRQRSTSNSFEILMWRISL